MKTPNRLLLVLLLAPTLSMTCGSRATVTPSQVNALPVDNNQGPASIPPAPTPTPETVVSLEKGLSIVPKQITLEDQKLRYTVDLTYPEVQGSKDPRIRHLNREIRRHVSEPYYWMLSPSPKDLRYYHKMHPEALNSVDSTYEVILATNEFVSIYIDIYSYGIGAAHSVQQSFTVNYDFRSRRLLTLKTIFRRDPNYLTFVSQYCIDDLRKKLGNSLFEDELSPKHKNYQSWNITKDGIRINFDACKLEGCLAGKQSVLMPFAKLKGRLRSDSLFTNW